MPNHCDHSLTISGPASDIEECRNPRKGEKHALALEHRHLNAEGDLRHHYT